MSTLMVTLLARYVVLLFHIGKYKININNNLFVSNLDRNRLSHVTGDGAGLESLQELRLVKNALTDHALADSNLLSNLPALTTL